MPSTVLKKYEINPRKPSRNAIGPTEPMGAAVNQCPLLGVMGDALKNSPMGSTGLHLSQVGGWRQSERFFIAEQGSSRQMDISFRNLSHSVFFPGQGRKGTSRGAIFFFILGQPL